MAIERLPTELILIILEHEDITITDVINFSATCQQFRHTIINNNNLWKKKFFQRWPTAKKAYENMLIDKSLYHISIIDVKAATKCTKELWDYVSHMSERHYHYSGNHKYSKDFSSLFLTSIHCLDKHPMHFFFLKDELISSIYTQSPWQCDLTQRYYSMKLLQCLVTRNFRIKSKQFKRKPHQQKILEQMFTFVMQWCRPEQYIYYFQIDKFLDDIKQEILTNLRKETPMHRIFLLSPEQFFFWKNNSINENYWGEMEAKQIKHILDKIILNFGSYNLNYPWKSDQISDSYIQESYNEKILWLITYVCVARRMGIYMEIAEHPSERSMYPLNVHLIWKPRGHTGNIECFNFLMDCQSNLPIPFTCVCRSTSNPVQMPTKKLIEALKMVFQNYIPRDISLSLTSKIDFDNNMCICFRFGQHERRSHEMKFAVGMVIRCTHSEDEHNEDYVGVIIGWHDNYQTRTSYHFRQPDFSQYNAEDCLYYLQPFYIVLTDNSGIIYVSQSAITSVCTSMDVQWIDNPEVGRYFCRFERHYYIPNNMLHRQYPQDAAFVRETFNNL